MFKNTTFRLINYSLVCLLAAALATGCKGKQEEPLDTDYTEPMTTTPDSGEGQPDLDLERLLFDRAEGLQTVYFAFDSSALSTEAMATLRSNAEKIKQVPGVIIQVAGHCDERGTQEYNLALGERRALAVREHLINLGVPGNRIITISYGKEQPAVPGNNEAAWAMNRRAEFNRATSY